MPSQLVDTIRSLLRERAENGRPLTAAERALLLATVARYDRKGGMDAVDELEAAIAHARRVCLSAPIDTEVRRAVTRLLAASRGVLDFTPADTEFDPAGVVPEDTTDRPRQRADLDG